MQAALVAAIGKLVNSMPEIVEAHLPQCYVPSTMQQPAQVLIFVPAADADLEHSLKSLPAIRKAGCSLKPVSSSESEVRSQPRKWWKPGSWL
jgi:hypothetical protein